MSDTPSDPAVVAFEALRAEIAAVRATLATWPDRLEERDYAPTLAAIAKTLEVMAAHPALKATPEDYERRRSRALDDAAQAYRSELNVIRAELQGKRRRSAKPRGTGTNQGSPADVRDRRRDHRRDPWGDGMQCSLRLCGAAGTAYGVGG